MANKILNNEFPNDFIYAPNYWQWFAHHKNHNILPDEIKHCETQLDLIRYLGLEVMSMDTINENFYSRVCYDQALPFFFLTFCLFTTKKM